jgi:hypothetical protein
LLIFRVKRLLLSVQSLIEVVENAEEDGDKNKSDKGGEGKSPNNRLGHGSKELFLSAAHESQVKESGYGRSGGEKNGAEARASALDYRAPAGPAQQSAGWG